VNDRPLSSTIVSRAFILGAIGIVLAVFAAYIPAINAGYIWDDDSYVTANIFLRDMDGLWQIWIPGRTAQYYPIVFSSFWIEYQLWELNPMGYHIVNVLLHAANAILLWLVMLRLRVPGAWLIGAVFALHPVHVESVAWITERKNVLSMFFYLLAALAYLRFDAMRFGTTPTSVTTTAQPSLMRSPVLAWYVLAMLAFVLALLSKSVTCSLPAALILALLWLRQPITIKRLLPLAPMFIVGFVLAMNTALLERVHVGAVGPDFAFSFLERCLIASRALLFYPWKLLWPSELIFIYPRWEIDASSAVQYLPLLVLVVTGVILLELYRRGWRGPFLSLSLYAGTVFPAIGFFNVYPHLFSFVADHFVYHASVGVLAFVIGGAAYLLRNPMTLRLAALAILPVLFVLTYLQSIIYYNEETLWRDTIAKNPDAWMPRNNLASRLLEQAELARLAGEFDQAMAHAAEAQLHAEAALDVRPHHHTAHSNRSEALRFQGKYEQALEAINNAITYASHLADYHWQQGRLYQRLGQLDSAAQSLAAAVERDPDNISFRLDLARILTQLGRFDEASEQFTAVLHHQPNNIIALGSLAGIRTEQGAHAQARRLYERALDSAGTFEEQVQIVPRLIRLLLTSTDPAVRSPGQAVQLAEQLVRATQRQDPAALAMLASVYHDAGQTADAIATAREGLALAQQHGIAELVTQLEQQLAAYQSQQ
jgi:tetratricopeptide (TPR) repeat protein